MHSVRLRKISVQFGFPPQGPSRKRGDLPSHSVLVLGASSERVKKVLSAVQELPCSRTCWGTKSGCSRAWYGAGFGSQKSEVRILPPRLDETCLIPTVCLEAPGQKPLGPYCTRVRPGQTSYQAPGVWGSGHPACNGAGDRRFESGHPDHLSQQVGASPVPGYRRKRVGSSVTSRDVAQSG